MLVNYVCPYKLHVYAEPRYLYLPIHLRHGVVIRVPHLSMENKKNGSQELVHALTIAKVLVLTSIAE